jgi:hypothetical protein
LRAEGRVEFLCPSPELIFFGGISLRSYPDQSDMGWVIRLRDQLEALDWSAFTSRYDPMGRKPIHPMILLGLTVYGILDRHSTLRDTCPAGCLLRWAKSGKPATEGAGKLATGQSYREYGGAPCGECSLRRQCTKSKQGRTVKRFEGDEYKEAMAQVMLHPLARLALPFGGGLAYGLRKAIVEPIFAELRERLGLTRFRRRGLEGVRLEFSLYCMAHNLKRAPALKGAWAALFGFTKACTRVIPCLQAEWDDFEVGLDQFLNQQRPATGMTAPPAVAA